MISEFDLIKQYFTKNTPNVMLGVGDDCALLQIPSDKVLATSTDTLIQGVHFFPNTNPYNLGHKALAVNLSDLAAMGAQPIACLLNLSLPNVDKDWLKQFSSGFFALANEAKCSLVGGDTTRSKSELTITVTVMGVVDSDKAFKRSSAFVGDDIWITGSLGAPHIALMLLQNSLPQYQGLLKELRPYLEKPVPPNRFARDLIGIANAAIDISDGLMQDLNHVLKASGCGAQVNYAALPIHDGLKQLPIDLQQQAALTGGDVYQLCFTANPKHESEIQNLALKHVVQATKIGEICAGSSLNINMPNKNNTTFKSFGYDHFK